MFFQNESELKDVIETRTKKAKATYTSVQPFLIGISSEDGLSPYIVVDETISKMDSIIVALDVCFKIFFALEAAYPQKCKVVYTFIQQKIYKIRTAFDKIYTTVEEVYVDLTKQEAIF